MIDGCAVQVSVTVPGSGELATVLRPLHARPPGSVPGAVHCHGRLGNETEAIEFDTSKTGRASHALGEVLPTVTPRMGGPSTGSTDVAMTALGHAVAYAKTISGYSSKVVLSGLSAGAPLAFRWALANPTQVAGIVSVIGVADTDEMYDDPEWTAIIDAIYGGRPGSVHNPSANVAAIAALGVPVFIDYSTDDEALNPATQAAFAAALATAGADVTVATHTGGHTLTAFDKAPLVDWLTRLA